MSIVFILLGLFGGLVVDALWVALFRARAAGRFQVLQDGYARYRFRTDVGEFSIYPREQRLDHPQARGRASVAFADIRGLEYRVNPEYAWLQELFFGYGVTDLLGQYHDTVEWYSLAVVLHDGTRVPLYLSGQYVRREFLMGWYLDAQAWVLERLRLARNVEDDARATMENLRARLGDPPLR